MNFTLPEPRTVTLDHINIRTETHGDKKVKAVDLRFIMSGGNELLGMFHADLQLALCFNQAAKQGQEPLDAVPTVLPNLRFPKLAPIVWQDKITTARVEIDYGLGGESNIVLNPCKVNQFKIELKEGGSAAVTFCVQSVIQDESMGALIRLLNEETQITLTLPVVSTGTIDGSKEAFEKDYPGAAKPGDDDATDLFVNQAGAADAPQ